MGLFSRKVKATKAFLDFFLMNLHLEAKFHYVASFKTLYFEEEKLCKAHLKWRTRWQQPQKPCTTIEWNSDQPRCVGGQLGAVQNTKKARKKVRKI